LTFSIENSLFIYFHLKFLLILILIESIRSLKSLRKQIS